MSEYSLIGWSRGVIFVLSGTYSISGSISIEKNLFWFCRIMTLRTERDCIKFPAFQQNRINLLRKGHMEASCLSAHVFGVRLGQMVQAGFLAAEWRVSELIEVRCSELGKGCVLCVLGMCAYELKWAQWRDTNVLGSVRGKIKEEVRRCQPGMIPAIWS